MSETASQPENQPKYGVTSSLVLNKFKLVKFGAEADYTEHEVGEDDAKLTTEIYKKFPFQPKDELLAAFDALVPHLMMLCEVVDAHNFDKTTDVLQMKLAESFKVTGIVVKSSGMTLIGRRSLRGGKVLNLTTPFLLWENAEMDVDEGGYEFATTLLYDIDLATSLALQYIEGDYYRKPVNVQLSIDFDNPDPLSE